jgi:multicomponent Na+:H+ antiporter subunit D
MYGGPAKEAPLWCVAPLTLTALGSFLLFFFPEPFLGLAQLAAAGLFGR